MWARGEAKKTQVSRTCVFFIINIPHMKEKKMIRACCECVRHLKDDMKYLSIIGCTDKETGDAKDCVDCEDELTCTIRLVYPDDASHGLCDGHFNAAMSRLDNEQKARRANAKKKRSIQKKSVQKKDSGTMS